MAPSLRQKTKDKTEASTKAAKDAGFVARTRKPPSRRQMYKRNKGLLDLKTSKDMQDITNANAANSPLLLLPPEIRNEIFCIAMTAQHRNISLCFSSQGRVSRSMKSSHPDSELTKEIALALPRVCRQIYFETATLLYSENTFTFPRVPALKKWLSRRILAQREAIEFIYLPRSAYYYSNIPGPLVPMSSDARVAVNRPYVETKIKQLCPNLVSMQQDDFLDNYSSEAEMWNNTSRIRDPSSADDLASLVSD
ncbi:hypothetical protein NX059_003754 [Plenodomus lindquistii]|nr:hypothetical protein NX059_003754 [Plenodomus lindquistii]